MQAKARATGGWPRDYVGYGRDRPDPQWPGGARIAVNFNLAYEAGGELNILDGDAGSETLLSDTGAPSVEGARHPLVESSFEYGSRVGVWRLLRMFEQFEIPASIVAVATALERNPEVCSAFVELGHEIVNHGYRWIDYMQVDEATEREHIRLSTDSIERTTGVRPQGWLTGRPGPNTRRLLVEAGGYLYDRDVINDELPYWIDVGETQHLTIPYSFETNDNRSELNLGFAHADDFLHLPPRRVRPPLPGGSGPSRPAVHRAPRPADRTAGPRSRPRPTTRPHAIARRSLVLPRHRHRSSLASDAPRLESGDPNSSPGSMPTLVPPPPESFACTSILT